MEGDSLWKQLGCAGTLIAALVVGAFALVALPSIERSQADQARAEASVENARAAAVAAQAQARVDEAEVQADRDVQLQLDRQDHELALLREENRQFQERLVMLATVIEGMDGEKVSRLERWLGMNGTSPVAIAAAVYLAVLVFVLALVLRRYVNRKWEETWTT